MCSLAITTKLHFQSIQLPITTSIWDSPHEDSLGVLGVFNLVLSTSQETSENSRETGSIVQSYIRSRDGEYKKNRLKILEGRRFKGFNHL